MGYMAKALEKKNVFAVGEKIAELIAILTLFCSVYSLLCLDWAWRRERSSVTENRRRRGLRKQRIRLNGAEVSDVSCGGDGRESETVEEKDTKGQSPIEVSVKV